MAKLLKLRRGTTTQHGSFTGAEGEVTIDTTKDTAVIHDGSTQGGTPLAKENMDNVSSANIAARIGANAIDGSKISDGTITNAEVNASAAIAGTKVAPYFGSQDITTTGHIDFPDDSSIKLGDNDEFVIRHTGAGVSEISSTKVDVSGNLDVSGTLDVTGKVDCQAGLETDGDVKLNSGTTNMNILFDASEQSLEFDDSVKATFGFDKDLQIFHEGANSIIRENGTGDLYLQNGTSNILRIKSSGVDVTGDISVTGNVDGVDVAALKTAKDSLSTSNGVIKSGVELASGVITGTHAASDNSTKIANTAFVQTAIANLVDSSPGALNTLNELAAAIGDDANFSTTVTNSIATKLPKSGGQMTGNITFSGSQTVDGRDLSADGSKLDGIESGATADQTKSDIDALNINADQVDGLHASQFLRSDQAVTTGSHFTVNGQLTVGQGTSSDIYMVDTDETTRRIHTNSNRIGFLTSASAWGCYADNSGNWVAAGNVTAYSDARLKTDISTINDALGIVGKLRGVSYKWLKDGSDSIGLIAQEVEEVLPEVVVTGEGVNPVTQEIEEIKSVDYGKIVGVLINAINELNTKLEAQESYFLGELEKHKSGGH